MTNPTEETVTISKKEYKQLLRDSKRLLALVNGGVDNWQGYDYAMEMMPRDDEEE